jgi:hypothetical protein
MTQKSAAKFVAIAALVAMPTLSWAGTAAKETKTSQTSAPEKLQESAISGNIGVNVVTAYYYRGILQHGASPAKNGGNHSPSLQPFADIYFKAYEGDGALNKAVVNLSVWNSFTNPAAFTGATTVGSKKAWFESDFTPGIALTFGKVTLTETYMVYAYPNDSASATSTNLNSKLAFDDSDLLGALALHPSITHMVELTGNAGTVAANKGHYWEAAVAPGVSAGPVAVTFPIALGYGSGKFYNKDGYAYTSAGVNVAYTLPLAKSYGTWTVNAGGTYYNTSKAATGNASDNDVVGSVGMAVAF